MDSSDATSAPQELDDVHNVVRIKDLRSKLLREMTQNDGCKKAGWRAKMLAREERALQKLYMQLTSLDRDLALEELRLNVLKKELLMKQSATKEQNTSVSSEKSSNDLNDSMDWQN